MKFCSYNYWINEKFTQDSDPVHDMGIGIESLFETVRKKIAAHTGYNVNMIDDENIIEYCLETCRNLDLSTTILNYMFSKKIDINQSGSEYIGSLIVDEDLNDKRVEIMLKLIFNNGYILKKSDFTTLKGIGEYFYNKSPEKRKKLVKDLFYEHSKKTNNIHLGIDMVDAFRRKDYKKVKELVLQGADPAFNDYELLKKAISIKNKDMVHFFADYLKKDPNFK